MSMRMGREEPRKMHTAGVRAKECVTFLLHLSCATKPATIGRWSDAMPQFGIVVM